ncbi:MAG: hypothetical protein H0T73_00655 [Ardenticatenales bacterium]|nr:hypothetical protein [Ardenticatenales bacterium]
MSGNLPSWLQGADVLDEPAAPMQSMSSYMDDTPAPAPSKRAGMEVHTAYIVRELANNTPRSDIIMTLVQKYNCPWDEAERFVSAVSIQNHDHIQNQQRPLIILITAGTLIAGIIMFTYGGIRLGGGAISQFVMSMTGTGFLMIMGGLYGVYQLVRDMAKG